MVIMVKTVINKKNICGAWSLELLGTPDFLKQIGFGGYLYFQERNIYAGLGY